MMDDFYIGYSKEKWPERYRFITRLFVLIVLLLSFITVLLFVRNVNDYADGNFDYNQLVELEGYLYVSPVPALLIAEGNRGSELALLTGFRKRSAGPVLQKWIDDKLVSREGEKVKLSRSLVEEGNRRILELTAGVDALIDALDGYITPPPIIYRKKAQLQGEILDAKCALGAMKPGHGKIHRSCAALCIASGMPALFQRMDLEANGTRYLIDWTAFKDNRAPGRYLSRVGEPVVMEVTIGNWFDYEIIKPEKKSYLGRIYSQIEQSEMGYCKPVIGENNLK